MTNRLAVVLIAGLVAVGLLMGGSALSSIGPIATDGQSTASGEVRAMHATMHLDRVGRPTVVGEVVNGRTTALGDVAVEVTFYEGGESIATVTGSVVATPVPSGDRMPFSIRAGELPENPTRFEVKITTAEPADGPVYEGFVVTDRQLLKEAQDQLFVNGEVENRGDEAGRVLVVATFYNDNGSVIGVRQVRPSPDTLEPGETGTFQIRFRTLGNVPSRAREFASFEFHAVRFE